MSSLCRPSMQTDLGKAVEAPFVAPPNDRSLGGRERLHQGEDGPAGGRERNELRLAAGVAVVEEELQRLAAGLHDPRPIFLLRLEKVLGALAVRLVAGVQA